MKINRVLFIVLDSLGCGYDDISYKYGDEGANTILNISKGYKEFKIPNLASLGLTKIEPKIEGVKYNGDVIGVYSKMKELSNGKDTLTGHFEFMGIETKKPFKTFTDNGFPDELIDELEKRTGYKYIGNISASGTEIIKDLGDRHYKTKELIIYTSADSVLQIAAAEDLIGLNELYRCCEIAREICMKEEWMVGRVIARPFVKDSNGNFIRTSNRHDYAVSPPSKTTLDYLKENNYDVISVGKINDIFNGCGITESFKTKSNLDGLNKTIELLKKDNIEGLIFVNLVDFDSLYGHRRDKDGYKKSLEEFDLKLGQIIKNLKDNDLLILSADHGNDPTWKGTDHTREYVPLMIYNKNIKQKLLETRSTFADIGKTISDIFDVPSTNIGNSFLSDILEK